MTGKNVARPIEQLSPADWEERLVAHYLRSDGPFGGAPLVFLDATPAEIALASGVEGVDDLEAQEAFISHFSHGSIENWLRGGFAPPAQDKELPTYFRYLVLTCLVSATDSGAGSTRNFRIRLGELLGDGTQFNSVAGVNRLWRSLVAWCERRRAMGEPFRRVVLPDPGSATLIGHAVRIAFPSWQDRSILAQILRKLPASTRRQPERLVQELSRSTYAHLLPDAVTIALKDFAAKVRGRNLLLSGHRFWRLAQSIDARIREAEHDLRQSRWRLEVRFVGYEQDVVNIAFFSGTKADEPRWEGSIQQFAELSSAILPAELFVATQNGTLILREAPGAVWYADDEGLPESCTVVVLARQGSPATSLPIADWTALEGGWVVSRRLDQSELNNLRRRLGLAPATVRLFDLTFEGGVKISHSTWLGRPAYLPTVAASPGSTLSLQGLNVTKGKLTVVGNAPHWNFEAEERVSGRWQVRAIEGELEAEKVIYFESDVPTRWEFPPADSAYEREIELVVKETPRDTSSQHLSIQDEDVEGHVWDRLEAIYASPPRGWAEGDLVKLLQPTLPSPFLIWDYLRSLAEADWLEPVISKAWRARVWRLREPYFLTVAGDHAIAKGSLATASRQRLADVAVARGATLIVRAGVSPWAPPTLILRGDVDAVSSDLDWRTYKHTWPRADIAPACWPIEPRSDQGRTVAGVWNFGLGLFLPPDRPTAQGVVKLERLVRERGDDRDLFRISGGGSLFLSSSRTAAILEAYRRRTEPLFDCTTDAFVRRTRSGHLPLPIARALATHLLRAPGIVSQVGGGWTYSYPTDRRTARWIGQTLGDAVALTLAETPKPFYQQVIESRRRGLRASWGGQRLNR